MVSSVSFKLSRRTRRKVWRLTGLCGYRIIPRNTVFDIMLALQPFGREMPLSFIPEWLIRTFHYRDQVNKSPRNKGLFAG